MPPTSDDAISFLFFFVFLDTDIQFSTMFYPDRDHSLRGPQQQTNQHLYRLLGNYLGFTLFQAPLV